MGGHDVALWETQKRIDAWYAECHCKEAAEATAALGLVNSSTMDQAGAALPTDSVQARIARAAPDLDLGIAFDFIRQADAMIATDVTWAFEGDCDPEAMQSNTFEIEWPPRSGRRQTYPEIDRVGFFPPDVARVKLLTAQSAFVDRVLEALGLLGDAER